MFTFVKSLIPYKNKNSRIVVVKPFVHLNCVWLASVLLLLSNGYCLTKILLDETYYSTGDKTCHLENVDQVVHLASEINCMYSCSVELHSIGITYNADSGTCKCCSEIQNVIEGSQTDTGPTFYFTSKEKPRDCDDLVRDGISSSGIYAIFADGRTAVNVYCNFDDVDGPWTVIQRRVDGTVSFNRSYKSYQEGFGNLTGSFWLGLDTISSITLQDNKIYTLKVVLNDRAKGKQFAKYSVFQVMNSSTYYRLNVYGYRGSAGDSLADHNGHCFTAYDSTECHSELNDCAKTFYGGWWYRYKAMYCLRSNLNGQYGLEEQGKGIKWVRFSTGQRRSASFATMELKANIKH